MPQSAVRFKMPPVNYNPSHVLTVFSIWESWDSESRPSFLKNFAPGIVAKFWASKTPLRKNGTLRSTSNVERRGLVVWAITVTKARSSSSNGTLNMKQERIFSAKPRSTSHIFTTLRITLRHYLLLSGQVPGKALRRLGLSPHPLTVVNLTSKCVEESL